LVITIGTGVINIFGAINAKWYTTKWPKQTADKAQQEDHQYNNPSQCSTLVVNSGHLLSVADVTIIRHWTRTKLRREEIM